MGNYTTRKQTFTMNTPETKRFVHLANLRKPSLRDWSLESILDGWVTVAVPHYTGTTADFYKMVNPS